MADMDPASGLPKEMINKKEDLGRINRLENQKARARELKDDLNSEVGSAVLNKIKEHFLSRVNALMDNDGECKALKKLLVEMGVEINMGEVAIERLLRLVTKRTREDTPSSE